MWIPITIFGNILMALCQTYKNGTEEQELGSGSSRFSRDWCAGTKNRWIGVRMAKMSRSPEVITGVPNHWGWQVGPNVSFFRGVSLTEEWNVPR